MESASTLFLRHETRQTNDTATCFARLGFPHGASEHGKYTDVRHHGDGKYHEDVAHHADVRHHEDVTHHEGALDARSKPELVSFLILVVCPRTRVGALCE